MKNKEVEEHIACAIKAVTPNLFEQIKSAEVTAVDKEVYVIKPKTAKSKWITGIAAACAAFLFMMTGFYISANRIDSTIGIDVNPSIEITTNKDNRILKVMALNEDAKIILDDMDLRKVDLKVAVNAIIGSMVKNGYIDEVKNAILVSVENKDEEKARTLQTSITEDIANTLKESNINARIYNQQLTKDKSLEELAARYHISVGKAEFLLKLISKDPSLNMDQLVLLSLEELSELIASKNINLHDLVDYDEDDSIQENLEDAFDEDADDSEETEDDEDNKEEGSSAIKEQKPAATEKPKSENSSKDNSDIKDAEDDDDEEDDYNDDYNDHDNEKDDEYDMDDDDEDDDEDDDYDKNDNDDEDDKDTINKSEKNKTKNQIKVDKVSTVSTTEKWKENIKTEEQDDEEEIEEEDELNKDDPKNKVIKEVLSSSYVGYQDKLINPEDEEEDED
jgi:hypothetical protein